MKKHKALNLILYILIVIVVYAIILVAGLLILCDTSMKSQQREDFEQPLVVTKTDDLVKMAENLNETDGGLIQVFVADGVKIFDTYDFSQNINAITDIKFSCEQYIPQVQAGECIKKITAIYDDQQGTYRVVYVFGIPLICDNQVVGEVFNIQSPLYFSRTITTFAIFFSIAYFIVAASISFVLIMRRRLEMARAVYIDNVTHALKTPVTAIKALAETLNDGMEPDPEEQKINLELIIQQADVQAEMVQNMLSLSRIQTGRVAIKKKKVSADELVADPIKKHKAVCAKKNIDLVIGAGFKDAGTYYTDPEVVRKILDIFVDNAVKFTPDGGKIALDTYTSGNKAVISLKDTGVGISKESLNKIFDRFYTTSIGNAEGNGLGLAIAKELAKQLKEKIWAESIQGEGTTMFLTVSRS